MAIDRRVNLVGAGYIPYAVGIEERKSARGVFRAPGFNVRSHDLDVLLRSSPPQYLSAEYCFPCKAAVGGKPA